MSSAATRRTGASRCSNSSLGDARGELGAEAAGQLILVRDDDAVGAPRPPRQSPSQSNGTIVRRSITIDADAVLLRLLRRQQRALHERAPGDDDDVGALAADGGLAERHHVVGAGVLALVVGLAVEVLVLEEEHRVVAADRRAQQAGGVLRVRREHDADAGAVREDALAGLAVVRRAAAQVAADRRRGSPSGTRRRCSSGSAASTSRRGSASSPARCSRRTGSRRPA